MKIQHYVPLILFCFLAISSSFAQNLETNIPGVVVKHLPKSTNKYIGSPAVCILPNGNYLASHDEFGPESSEHTSAITRIYTSRDKGKTWKEVAMLNGQFWSNLFITGKDVYLMGTDRHHGNVVIRKSSDNGKTWTVPKDSNNGLLLQGEYHTAPVPVVIHQKRVWRAIENASSPIKSWGKRYSAMILSAPVNSDLLNAANWQASNWLPYNETYLDGKFGAWLEGNIVVNKDNQLVDILRVDVPKGTDEYAAVVPVNTHTHQISFDPESGFVKFPGGSKKFTIRYDKKSKMYWSLINYVAEKHKNATPGSVRNKLVLICSADLKHWRTCTTLLEHTDIQKHGFQYVDWCFDGKDIIFVSRTAFDDAEGGASNYHDANYLTFHRIKNFRKQRSDFH